MKNISILKIIMIVSVIITLTVNTTPAQTSSVTGTVYENDQVKTTFKTPEGTIKVYLPDDMRPGDEVTGMVVAQPNGKDEKEKTKNLNKLLKYGLILPGGLALTAFETGQSGQLATAVPKFTVPQDDRISINLNSPGKKPYSSVELPTIPDYIENISSTPTYVLAKKVITDTEPLVLLQESNSGETPSILLSRYHTPTYSGETEEWYILNPSVCSPRKVIYNLPEKLSGMYNVNVRLQEGAVKRIDLVNIVDIQATIGKGSLMKGESTQLDVQVFGLEGCPYFPVELEISNLSPSVVRLAQGNQQLFPVDRSDNPAGFITGEPFCSTQDVIGLTPGTFTLNTTLHIPPAAYANTVYPYIEATSAPQDFNATIDGLKEDITNFSRKDVTNPGVINYLEKIKDKLPSVESPDDLPRAKSETINLLNTLAGITGGAAFFSSLTTLNKMHPDIAKKVDAPQFVHPLHNYAGEFYSETKLLILNPDCQQELLDYLKAAKLSNGKYTIILSDGTNPVAYTDVELKSATLEKDESKFVTRDNRNNDEPQLEEPLKEGTKFTDREGRKYIMYKNAQCKVLCPADVIECFAEYDFVKNEKTGKEEKQYTGKYLKISNTECKKCYAGTEICIEMWMIWRTWEYYDDIKCTRLIKIETLQDFLDP